MWFFAISRVAKREGNRRGRDDEDCIMLAGEGSQHPKAFCYTFPRRVVKHSNLNPETYLAAEGWVGSRCRCLRTKEPNPGWKETLQVMRREY